MLKRIITLCVILCIIVSLVVTVLAQEPKQSTSLRREFYYQTSEYTALPYKYTIHAAPDPNYAGHPVTITPEERNALIYTLYKECGADKAGCILIAQLMRDSMDYNNAFTSIRNMICTSFSASYWYSAPYVDTSSAPYEKAKAALEYVFDYGNSAFPHKMLTYMQSSINPNGSFYVPCYPAISYYCGIGVPGTFWYWDTGDYINPNGQLDDYLENYAITLQDVSIYAAPVGGTSKTLVTMDKGGVWYNRLYHFITANYPDKAKGIAEDKAVIQEAIRSQNG